MLHKEKTDSNRNQYGFYILPDAHFLRQVEPAINYEFFYCLLFKKNTEK